MSPIVHPNPHVPTWLERVGSEGTKDLRYRSKDARYSVVLLGRKVIRVVDDDGKMVKRRLRIWQVFRDGQADGPKWQDLQLAVDHLLTIFEGKPPSEGKKRARAKSKTRKRKAPPRPGAKIDFPTARVAPAGAVLQGQLVLMEQTLRGRPEIRRQIDDRLRYVRRMMTRIPGTSSYAGGRPVSDDVVMEVAEAMMGIQRDLSAGTKKRAPGPFQTR